MTVANRVHRAGITGQDGSSLAPFLLNSGDAGHGSKRRACSFNTLVVDQREVARHGKKMPRAEEG